MKSKPKNQTQKKQEEICPHFGEPIRIRNRSGYCDHLYYPDHCQHCQKPSQAQEWENQVDNIVPWGYKDTSTGHECYCAEHGELTRSNVKALIRDLLSSQRKQLREKIEQIESMGTLHGEKPTIDLIDRSEALSLLDQETE